MIQSFEPGFPAICRDNRDHRLSRLRGSRGRRNTSNPERFFKTLIDKGCLGRAQTAIQPAGNRRETGSLETAALVHGATRQGWSKGSDDAVTS